MCYAGGPYCDKGYTKAYAGVSKKIYKLEQEKESVNNQLQKLDSKLNSGQDFTAKDSKKAQELLHKRDYVLEQKLYAHEAQQKDAFKKIMLYSPAGIESLEADRLSAEILVSDIEKTQGWVSANDKDARAEISRRSDIALQHRAYEFEKKHDREMFEKYVPKDKQAEYALSSTGGFKASIDDKKFTYSHPEHNGGKAFFTEKAKPELSEEDLEKIGEKSGSTRVIYNGGNDKNGNPRFITGNLVSDGNGRTVLFPDQKHGQASPIEIYPEDSEAAQIRPTDAPGHNHNPHVNRSGSWDRAAKSKNKSKAKAAQVWNEYKDETDTPAERELRAKSFNTEYSTAVAKKKYLAESRRTKFLVAEAKEQGVSKAELKKIQKKQDNKLVDLRSEYESARFISDRTTAAWKRTPKGSKERTDLGDRLIRIV